MLFEGIREFDEALQTERREQLDQAESDGRFGFVSGSANQQILQIDRSSMTTCADVCHNTDFIFRYIRIMDDILDIELKVNLIRTQFHYNGRISPRYR